MTSLSNLRCDVRAVVLSKEETLFLTKGRRFIWKDKVLPAVIPLLDGTRTDADIALSLSSTFAEPEVHRALDELRTAGYLVAASPSGTLSMFEAAFWQNMGVQPADAERRLTSARVVIESIGSTDADPVRAAVEAIGIRLSSPADLHVVVADDYLNPELEALNRDSLDNGRPWMLLRPFGYEAWVGPIFSPQTTGCWMCLAHRLRENEWITSTLWAERGGYGPHAPRGALSTTVHAASSLAATEIAAFLILGRNEHLEGALLSVDFTSPSITRHILPRQPRCKACGTAASLFCDRIVLKSRPKYFASDAGGYRTCSPEETVQRLQRHISPVTGIVPALKRHNSSVAGLTYIYTAACNSPLFAGSACPAGGPQQVVGKGPSDMQARASCLAEAVERYSAIWRGDEPRTESRGKDLSERACTPPQLLRFSERQYRSRDDWNRRHEAFSWVPEPYDENEPIWWTRTWSLTRDTPVWLPTAFCYLQTKQAPGTQFCRGDSNGLSSGNTLEEAVLQGLLEVIERDSTALWWYTRASRRALDVGSFGMPFCDQVRRNLQRAGRTMHVLDLTSDLQIPVFAAVSAEQDERNVVIGLGAHLDPALALSRAICELTQMLARYATEPRERLAERIDAHAWLQHASTRDQPWLLPSAAKPVTTSVWRQPQTEDLSQDLQYCIGLLDSRGYEVLALDLSRPDIGFPVVRVVVPGLRHLWPRFGPGRLYDTPFQLGWIDRPLSEEELNPFPYPS